jgi:hypothetical protein
MSKGKASVETMTSWNSSEASATYELTRMHRKMDQLKAQYEMHLKVNTQNLSSKMEVLQTELERVNVYANELQRANTTYLAQIEQLKLDRARELQEFRAQLDIQISMSNTWQREYNTLELTSNNLQEEKDLLIAQLSSHLLSMRDMKGPSSKQLWLDAAIAARALTMLYDNEGNMYRDMCKEWGRSSSSMLDEYEQLWGKIATRSKRKPVKEQGV